MTNSARSLILFNTSLDNTQTVTNFWLTVHVSLGEELWVVVVRWAKKMTVNEEKRESEHVQGKSVIVELH